MQGTSVRTCRNRKRIVLNCCSDFAPDCVHRYCGGRVSEEIITFLGNQTSVTTEHRMTIHETTLEAFAAREPKLDVRVLLTYNQEATAFPSPVAKICISYHRRRCTSDLIDTQWTTLQQLPQFLQNTIPDVGNICIDYLRPSNLPLWVLLGEPIDNTTYGIRLSVLCSASQEVGQQIREGLVKLLIDKEISQAINGLNWMVKKSHLDRRSDPGPWTEEDLEVVNRYGS